MNINSLTSYYHFPLSLFTSTMKNFILFFVLFTLTSPLYGAAVVLETVKDEQGRDRFETRYKMTPMPLAQPYLKYSLYWDYADRLSGNAAFYYELAYSEMVRTELRKTNDNARNLLAKIWDKAAEDPPVNQVFLVENTIPFVGMNSKYETEKSNFTSGFYMNIYSYQYYHENFESHLDDAKKFVEQYAEVFQLLERGSRCEFYDLGISYRESSFIPNAVYSPVQHVRDLTRVLQIKILLEIYEGRYEDAVKSARIGMEMAKHIGDQPTLVCPLVGIAIHGIMHAALMELLDRPDAPNLYWAVTNRPNPYFHFAQSAQAEKAMLNQMFPLLKKATDDPNTLSGEEWKLFCRQADQMIQEMSDDETASEESHPAISVETAYPGAREWLKQQGKTDEEIDAMSKENVVGLQAVHDIQFVWGDQYNAVYLPIWERLHDPEKDEPFYYRKSLAHLSPYARMLGGQFVPALDAGRQAFRRVQLQNDTLRISQALRIYMAEHDGKLPEKLEEIKSVPVPCVDPYTGKPFRYRLENGVGIIEIPEHVYPLTVYFEPVRSTKNSSQFSQKPTSRRSACLL